MRRHLKRLLAAWRPVPVHAAIAAANEPAPATHGPSPCPPFPGVVVRSWAERQAQLPMLEAEYARRREIERTLAPATPVPFDVKGFCAVCNAPRAFHSTFAYAYETATDGRQLPNWREHLVCSCGFGNRVRA